MSQPPPLQLPQRLQGLGELAYNLWWSWRPEARSLFRSVDLALWRESQHNPVRLLQSCPAGRLEALARDPAFLEAYDAVMRGFQGYLRADGTWAGRELGARARPVAYFSAEFGVHNSLPIYSGGLGILAGDHCKTASDLGVPLIGVGFMYPQGYVRQQVDADGWQQNIYDRIDWGGAPVRPASSPGGGPGVVQVALGEWLLGVAVFRVALGRVPLYLMDTNVEGNSPADREISGRLYGGDQGMRLRQEIVLGIGGVRVLRALGVPAEVFHANEGHSAFLFLERIRELVAQGLSFERAREALRAGAVFTTHTPVAAGHDVFPEPMIEEHFRGYWPALGLDRDRFLELGRSPGAQGWNMTALALRLAGRSNGVSRRHGVVSRAMWRGLWPQAAAEHAPIGHVTNGVHLSTWMSQPLSDLLRRHLGPDWEARQDEPAVWEGVARLPDQELWRLHKRMKRAFLSLLRARARGRWMRDRADPAHALAGGAMLDPEVLTIGCARRFASYKRATLILRDLERLKRLLLDPWRPVQIVFAGKAHPADDEGKKLIQRVCQLARDPAFGGRVAFAEDYDMHLAHFFVQGCDLWLNNPMPPLEACGTSGQKAAVNGVPNLSVLDGWWEEGYNGANGWAIGEGAPPAQSRDASDAESLYSILETKVVPLYYERGPDGLPAGWVRLMKESIRSVAPGFCSARMVKEYARRLYAGLEAAAAP